MEISTDFWNKRRIATAKERKRKRGRRLGVYVLHNKRNGDMYVGQSKELWSRRSQHMSGLKTGHYNQKIADAVDEVGWREFEFIVVEFVEPQGRASKTLDKLLDREQHWIDLLEPEYNIMLDNRQPELWTAKYSPAPKIGDLTILPPLSTKAPLISPYRKPGETFDRPRWHKWVYGGEKNPASR